MQAHSSLHHKILRHQSIEAIQEIREVKDAKNLDEVNEDGWTPLQLAAGLGEMSLVFALLEAGANPYHTHPNRIISHALACINGHPHITEIIKSYQELPLQVYSDYIKANLATFFRAITHYHPEHTKVLPNLYDASNNKKSGFLELAAYLNYPTLVGRLLRLGFKPRQDILIRTVGYWAAVHDNEEIFIHATQTAEDAIYTLYQLRQDKQPNYEKYLAKVSHHFRDVFISKTVAHKILDTFDDSPNTATYKAACTANQELLEILCNSHFDRLYATAEHAYRQRNFVALHQCILYWQKQTRMHSEHFRQILKDRPTLQKNTLLLFWLFTCDISPYDVILSPLIKKNESTYTERNQLINSVCSIEGLILHAMSRLISAKNAFNENDFVRIEKSGSLVGKAFEKYLKLNPLALTTSLPNALCLPSKSSKNAAWDTLPRVIWMKIILEFLRGQKIFSKDTPQISQDENKEKKEEKENKNEQKSQPAIRLVELDFDDPRRTMPTLSKAFQGLCYSFNRDYNEKKFEQLSIRLQQETHQLANMRSDIESMYILLNLINIELDAIGYFKDFYIVKSVWKYSLLTLISGALVGLNIHCVLQLKSIRDYNFEQLSLTFPKPGGPNCYFISGWDDIVKTFWGPCIITRGIPAICSKLCDVIHTNDYLQIPFSGFTTAILGLVFLLNARGIPNIVADARQDKRKHIELYFLEKFSHELQQLTASIFAKEKMQANPTVTIRAILEIIIRLIIQKEKKLNDHRKIMATTSRALACYKPPLTFFKPVKKPIAALPRTIEYEHKTERHGDAVLVINDDLETPLLAARPRRRSPCGMCVIL